jgi:hypothetical protein
MRKLITSTALLLALVFTMNSCQKGDIAQDVNSLGIGSYVTLTAAGNLNVDATNLAGKVSIEVAQYGSEQEKIIMYVSKGNTSLNRSTWKKLKEVPIASGSYKLEVSGQEIATALALTPAPGDQYTIYNQIVTKDGRTFDVVNTFADFAGLPAYNMALTWKATVVCPFVPAAATGTYVITADNWDGATGEPCDVTATASSATLTYAFPYAAPPGVNPLVLTVNPATGGVTVAKQTYGSYGTGFENFTANGSGFFFSCTGQITLSLTHLSGTGTNYGTYPLRLSKL